LDTLTLVDHGVSAVGILAWAPSSRSGWTPCAPSACSSASIRMCPASAPAHALRARMAAAGLDPHLVALPEGVKDVNQLFTERPDLVSEWAALREA